MIKQFISKLLGKTSADASDSRTNASAAKSESKSKSKIFGSRKDIPAKVHGIDPDHVDRRALDVVSTLQRAGYEAYIVGGAVRDLLLGLAPKDFDVATNATPEQVKSLFRRAFIIGRRFRIVHVVFGRGRDNEVIEVTTLRAYLDNSKARTVSGNEKTSRKALENIQHAVDASGRVLRDNVWGTLPEDAARRDFSINAMYYDPITEVVVDFHNGLADAKKLKIRMIGDPATRYREDPVRMIRAIRFAAKLSPLGFALETKTERPLHELQSLLDDIPPSRMFDEMLKMLQTGHALATVQQLRALHLETGIYPLLDLVVAREKLPLVHAALKDTDRRVSEHKSVAPSFLLACVLWEDVRQLWQANQDAGIPAFPALQEAIDAAFDRHIGDVSGRGKLGADMREIWNMQPRFDKRVGKTPLSLVQQPRFRAGFDFLRLRAQAGEVPMELANWWERFSVANEHEQYDLLDEAKNEARTLCRTSPAKTTRNRRKSKADDAASTVDGAQTPSTSAEPKAPRKPRISAAKAQQTQADRAQADHDSDDQHDNPNGPVVVTSATVAPAKKRRRRRTKPATQGPEAAPQSPAQSQRAQHDDYDDED